MTDRTDRQASNDPATGSAAEEDVAARGYRHTPGNEGPGNTASAGTGAEGGGPDAVDEFGGDPAARDRFDASNAYAGDVDPDEMGGLPRAAGGTGTGGATGSS